MMNLIRIESTHLETLFSNSRVASLRWDVHPWGLVLDLDVPLSEESDAERYRAWAIFEGVNDIYLPFECIRLPVGFWTNGFDVNQDLEFNTYSIGAQLPKFTNNEVADFSSSQRISIQAKNAHGYKSTTSARANKFNFLEYDDRTSLASDLDFRSAITSSVSGN